MSDLTKQERILAYRMVDEILSRPVPAVVVNHQIERDSVTLADKAKIIERADYILKNLREDAKYLWKEG